MSRPDGRPEYFAESDRKTGLAVQRDVYRSFSNANVGGGVVVTETRGETFTAT